MISNILFQIPKYTRQNTKFDNLSLINNQKITVEPNKKVLTNDEISFKKLPSLEGFSVLKTVSLIEPKNGHKVPADIMSDFKPLKDSRTYYIVVNKEIIGEMLLTRVKNEDYGTFKNPEKCDFVKLIDID